MNSKYMEMVAWRRRVARKLEDEVFYGIMALDSNAKQRVAERLADHSDNLSASTSSRWYLVTREKSDRQDETGA